MFTKISYKSFFGSGSRRYNGIESKKLGELRKIDVVIGKLFKVHERQYKVYLRRRQKEALRAENLLGRKEEAQAEKGRGRIGRVVKSVVSGVLGFPGVKLLLETLVKLAILKWIADPKNKEAIIGFVKFLSGLFKFITAVAGFAVGNILDGLYQIIEGPILSKIFGVLKLIVGLFALRYLLKPWKIISDVSKVWKNRKVIQSAWKGFVDGAKNGLKPAIEGVLKALPATASLFKHGLKRGLTRAILKVFGKGGFRILSGAARMAAKAGGALLKGAKSAAVGVIGKGAARTVGKVFSKVPIVGPLIGLAINLALGDPLDKAIFKAVTASAGQAIGAWVGGAIGTAAGTVVPVIGNILAGGAGVAIGSILGGLVGDFLGDKAYDWFKQGSDTAQKTQENTPKLAAGGIVTKETKAIIGEAGPEAVIPLKEMGADGIVGKKIIEPFKIVGSAILGTMFKVITSFGPLGVAIIPLLKTVMGPSIKMFGMDSVATSGIKQEGSSGNVPSAKKLIDKKSSKKDKKIIGEEKINILQAEKDSDGKKVKYQARRNKGGSVRSLLGDILNNIIQLDFASKASAITTRDSQTPGGGGGGGAPPPVTPGAKGLLDFIAHYESGGDYNKIFGGKSIAGLTDKTIEQVVQIQKAHLAQGYESAAIGRYQMMLPEVYAQRAGLSLKDKFSPENQDKMAMVYLEEDGWSKYLAGKISADQFADNVAGTWAAMPTRSGSSAHQGTGSNRSLVDRQRYMQQIVASKEPAKMQTGGVVKDRPWNSGIPLSSITTKSGKSFQVASALAPKFKGFVGDLEGTGYRIKEIGGWRKAGSGGGSGPPDPDYDKGRYHHPYGASIDINPSQNPYRPDGRLITDFPSNINDIAKKWGLGWGGNWRSSKDTMHFSAGKSEGGSGYDMNPGGALWQGKPLTDGSSDSSSSSSSSDTSNSNTTDESQNEPIKWEDITAHFKTLAGALRGSPELPAAGTGPKISGMTLDEISQAYSKNTKPLVPLNNVVISGGTSQFNTVVSQDFSAFAAPQFNVDTANKFNFTGRL